MLLENFVQQFQTRKERLRHVLSLKRSGDCRNHSIERVRGDFFGHTTVGQDDDLMLEESDEKKNPVPALGTIELVF